MAINLVLKNLEWHQSMDKPREDVILLLKIGGRRQITVGFYSCGQWIELSRESICWEVPLSWDEGAPLLWSYLPSC